MEITEKILNEKGALYYSIGYLTSFYAFSKDIDTKNQLANMFKQIKLQYKIENQLINNLLNSHESNNI